MKGTNPETQGHRWAKRVKKRLKIQQKEDGQWEDWGRKKEREAEEAEKGATAAGDEFELESDSEAEYGTELRSEQDVEDEAELAALRAVKEAAAAAEERLARIDKETKDGETKSSSKSAKQNTKHSVVKNKTKQQVSSNPFAALGFGRQAPKKKSTEELEGSDRGEGVVSVSVASSLDTHTPVSKRKAGESQLDARNRLAAVGAKAAVDRKHKLGIKGVAGLSAKKLKKQLKRARQAAEGV